MQSQESTFLKKMTAMQALTAAAAAVFSMFAAISSVAKTLYGKWIPYTELISGETIWRGYPKEMDLTLIHICLIGIPVLFFLFLVLEWYWMEKVPLPAVSGSCFLLSYFTALWMIFAQKEVGQEYLFLVVSLAIAYFLSAKNLAEKGKQEQIPLAFATLAAEVFLIAAAAASLFVTANVKLKEAGLIWGVFGQMALGCFGILLVFVSALSKSSANRQLVTKLAGFAPFVMALAPLGMFRFWYVYKAGDTTDYMPLFASGRWKLCCILLCVISLAVLIIRRKRGCEGPDWVGALIPAALLRAYSLPEGVMSIDYFHNGEILLPMQQLLSFGKIPYKDLIPIHGFCDYFYGLINAALFDNTYLSLNAAKSVGNLFMALFYAAVLCYVLKKRLPEKAQEPALFLMIWFALPYLTAAGMRYCLLFALLLILFSTKQESALSFDLKWFWLSMLAIAWNPSLGGAGAIAFFPLAIYRFVKGGGKELTEAFLLKEKKRLLALAVSFLGGIAFIPLFLGIVSYLRENAATTTAANGMEMIGDLEQVSSYFVPNLVGQQGTFFMMAFASLIALLLVFLAALKKEEGMRGRFIALILFLYVIAEYSYVRFDEGLRTTVVGAFCFLMLGIWYIAGDKQKRKICFAMILLFIWLAAPTPFLSSESNEILGKIPESNTISIMGKETEDPIVYLQGESAGIRGLGSGFLSGNALTNLQNLGHVLQSTDQKILDLTNAPAYEVIFEKELVLPYTSGYNISNNRMQDRAGELLESIRPEMVLIAPGIVFDEAPLSYRSLFLYQKLRTMGYKPRAYENVIYLLRDDIADPVEGSVDGAKAFADAMHKTDQGYLPAIWAGSMAQEGIHDRIERSEIAYRIEETDTGVRLLFDKPLNGDAFDLLLLTTENDEEQTEGVVKEPDTNSEETEVSLRLLTETETETETNTDTETDLATETEAETKAETEVKTEVKTDEGSSWKWKAADKALLPLCTSPCFTEQEKILGFEIEGKITQADFYQLRE